METSRKEEWRGKQYAFFSHKQCEYFPCHPGADAENFNCLFCYCPLYALGDKCGGDFTMTARGYKSCAGCTRPHDRENYGEMIGRYSEIMELIKQKNS